VAKRGGTRFDPSQWRITRGALILLAVELVVTIGFLVMSVPNRAQIAPWVSASPTTVWQLGHVWTLVTSPLLELDFIQLVMSALVLWLFVPTLERFWGTRRFYRFVAVTSIVGTVAGTTMGLALGRDVPISGLSPFIYASIVAFGILYAKQPVAFSFYIRMTGRQLMWGFLGFVTLFVLVQQKWEEGAAYAAAIVAAAMMTSKRWSPGLAWRRWRIARARARLTVLEGGKPRSKPDKERFIN
jgi:membrane associated rhomboid family serine protease